MVQSVVTASAVIAFAERLEDDSATFYRMLAERCTESKELFLSFAGESKRNKTLIVRTYQETITDALEACFCFKGMNLGEYSVHTTLPKDAKHTNAFAAALKHEEKAIKFCSDAARLSEGFLGTIPRVFKKIAEKRKARQQVIESLLGKSTTDK